MTFGEHLAACVQSPAHGAAFRQAIQADDGLRAAAIARLAEITAGPTPIVDRCHIARRERAALQEACHV